MSSSAHQRSLVLLLLVLWMTPGAGALALSLHLALDHHGSGRPGHGPAHEEELILATVHGHHHPELTSEHEHSAALEKTPTVRRAPKVTALASGAYSSAPASTLGDTTDAPHLRAPPDALFRTHCSLLL